MLNSIKISLKDSIIYGLGNIAVKVVGLILIPIYTDPAFFSIEDFGVIGMLEISGLVLIAFMASALPQSLNRWFWDKEHKNNQKGIFFMTLLSQVIISSIFCLLLIPLSETFSIIIFSTTGWSEVIKLVIIASGIQTINNIINALIRLQSKSFLFSVTNLIKLISVLSLTLIFILSKDMGIEGIYLAQVIGNSLFVLMLLGYLIKNSRVFFDLQIFKSMSVYGFPLLLANISAITLNVVDRFALNSLALLKYVALYMMAMKITSVLKLVFADSMKLALAPIMLKKMNSPGNKRFYSKVLLYSSYVLMFAVIAITLFSFEVIQIISRSNEFLQAVTIIPVLSLSVFFVNMKDLTVYGLHITKKTKIIGVIVIVSTIISLALNLLLIPIWDIAGAALATLLSQVIFWLACYYYSQKIYYVPYDMKKIFTILLTGAVLSFSGLLINNLELLPRIIIKTGCLISFPFILYLFKFYEPVELQSIKGFFIKWARLSKLGNNLKSLRNINFMD